MNTASRPTTEHFDTETQALLNGIELDVEVRDLDLDVAFGTPLDMYEADLLPHEQVTGEDMGRDEFLDALIAADAARRARMQAARDIVAADPSITALVRERLVDVLLPYAAQLGRPARPRTAAPVVRALPLAA
ncbi:hypothetical protein ACFXP3_04575 [Streptomyces sp. NPDC059096]|uniref:hypothetical protein n=1 Tax=Streptomyces sp. NPDC059096 TaxID=3346727 RepID=UPI0036AEEA09